MKVDEPNVFFGMHLGAWLLAAVQQSNATTQTNSPGGSALVPFALVGLTIRRDGLCMTLKGIITPIS